MTGVDDREAMPVDVDHDQQEGDEHVEHAAVCRTAVELLDDLRRLGVVAEREPDLGRQLGGQERRRHAFAHDIADGDRQPRRWAVPDGSTGMNP